MRALPFCPKCGIKLSNEMNFCSQCGVALGTATRPSVARIHERSPKEKGMIGLLSVGMVLIMLAITYIRYPVNSSVIIGYFQNMAGQKAFLKPPSTLFDPAIFFLSAAGVWGIVLSGLRIIVHRSVKEALGDLFGGFFSFFCVFLLTSYAADVFTEQTTGGYFVVGIGLLVIVNQIINLAFPDKAAS